MSHPYSWLGEVQMFVQLGALRLFLIWGIICILQKLTWILENPEMIRLKKGYNSNHTYLKLEEILKILWFYFLIL